jgi:hypothetical protein
MACAFNLGGKTIAHDAREGEIILALNGADARQLPPYAARFVLLA